MQAQLPDVVAGSNSPAPPQSKRAPTAHHRLLLLTALVALIVGVALRCAAIFGDLWLDEIWSLRLARSAASPLLVFTGIHHDNNHYLNSLIVRALGEQEGWVYRVPAALCGAMAVTAAGAAARRWGALEATLAVVLTGCSYLLIHFSTEARGYAYVVLFSFLAFATARRHLERPTWGSAAIFSACAALGFLSHLTFIHVYLGLLAWSLVRLLRAHRSLEANRSEANSSETRRFGWPDFARMHGAPVGLLVGLYLVDLRTVRIGGGDPYSIPDVVASTVALALGGSESPGIAVGLLGAGAALGLLAYGAWLLRSHGSDEWVFFVVCVVASPCALLGLSRPPVLFERYFLVCVACFLLLMARVGGWELRRGGWRRGLAVAAAAGFIASNFGLTLTLLERGRGHYLEALSFIVQQSGGGRVTLGSDHDFRNRMIVEFYAPYANRSSSLPTQLVLLDARRSLEPPQWMLVHDFKGAAKGQPFVLATDGSRYNWMRSYPYARLSGWNWHLYRRALTLAPMAGSSPAPHT